MNADLEEQEHVGPLSQSGKRKRKRLKRVYNAITNQKIIIEVDMIIDYCMECVTWEEAKPLINLLEAVFGINAPPVVKKGITKVKKKFADLIHGPSIHVDHTDVAVGVAEKGSNVYHHQISKKWKKTRKQNC